MKGLQTVQDYISNKYDRMGSVPCYLTVRLSLSLPNQLSLMEVDFSLLTLELPFQSKCGSQVPLSILAIKLKSKRWSSVFIYGTSVPKSKCGSRSFSFALEHVYEKGEEPSQFAIHFRTVAPNRKVCLKFHYFNIHLPIEVDGIKMELQLDTPYYLNVKKQLKM